MTLIQNAIASNGPQYGAVPFLRTPETGYSVRAGNLQTQPSVCAIVMTDASMSGAGGHRKLRQESRTSNAQSSLLHQRQNPFAEMNEIGQEIEKAELYAVDSGSF
jgi:hypothetical protein